MTTLFGNNVTKAELLARCGGVDQLGGIRIAELSDGPARGVRVAEIRTGSGLEVQVGVDRCLDITHGSFKGMPLCWRSSVGDIHPSFYEPEGAGWLRTFPGGVLATCGLTQVGAPNVDGDEELGVHGRIGAAMASKLSVHEGWEGDEYTMSVSGEMKETAVFGPHLVLSRKISAKLGSSSLLIENTIENRGHTLQPLMILFHFNIGWPIVSETGRLAINAEKTVARDEAAAPHLDKCTSFDAPADEFPEQVFCHHPKVAADGRTVLGILNDALGVGVTLRYRPDELPFFNQWKMTEKGHYVCGIEPANCLTGGRAQARESGDLEFIEPGQTRSITVEFGVVEGDELGRTSAEIDSLG